MNKLSIAAKAEKISRKQQNILELHKNLEIASDSLEALEKKYGRKAVQPLKLKLELLRKKVLEKSRDL